MNVSIPVLLALAIPAIYLVGVLVTLAVLSIRDGSSAYGFWAGIIWPVILPMYIAIPFVRVYQWLTKRKTLWLIAALLCSSAARAETPLITELGSDFYTVRRHAQVELSLHTRAHLDELFAALKNSDPEISDSAGLILGNFYTVPLPEGVNVYSLSNSRRFPNGFLNPPDIAWRWHNEVIKSLNDAQNDGLALQFYLADLIDKGAGRQAAFGIVRECEWNERHLSRAGTYPDGSRPLPWLPSGMGARDTGEEP